MSTAIQERTTQSADTHRRNGTDTLLSRDQLNSYDHIIITFSGGKDSTATLLALLEAGADRSKIELWHHDIDGREGDRLMDWKVTPDYCRAFAEAFELPLYFSWKVGGFSREMLRQESLTAPTKFQTPSGEVKQVGGTRGKLSTRRMFPQVSADLSVRWCSAYLKVDVCRRGLANQARFQHSRTLLVSGERAEESPGRARYAEFEVDEADNRDGRPGRHIDRYRPVHKWLEADVWDIIERHKVRVHPAYYIGWARVSCAACIFGSANQWATLHKIDPTTTARIADYEIEFGKTINRTKSVPELIAEGTPYETVDVDAVIDSQTDQYDHEIVLDEWTQPAGAFGESCGPV